MVSGTIDKSIVGKKQNSLIQVLNIDYDSQITIDFINNYQTLVDHYLLHRGFSVGIGDCVPVKSEIIEKEIEKCFIEARMVYNTEKNPEMLERKINTILNNANTIGEKMAKATLSPTNSLGCMIISGAKGNYVNISQIIKLLGQQNVDSKRIPKLFKQRTLPHYKKTDIDFLDPFQDPNDDNVIKELFKTRGFIFNSLYNGLKPDEMFFHAMGGRIGVIDTGIKTSVTGYISRRLVKKLEDLKVSYTGPIVNSKGTIISFDYNDGIDASKNTYINGKSSILNIKR